ncbi:hypothetical protein WMF04_49965 [Sorangium sp. So ce260]|uniref:hypothetical protein n=1 Tax=Sorangium sp. So ce260 TaxID=3133291 RepID=UPI003F620431
MVAAPPGSAPAKDRSGNLTRYRHEVTRESEATYSLEVVSSAIEYTGKEGGEEG